MSNDPRLAQVEQLLTSLATRLELPTEPDLARAVRTRLEAGSAARAGRAAPLWGTRIRTALAACVLVVALAATVVVFSPATRDAIADWIGLGGVRITHGPRPDRPLATDLALGDLVTLDDAAERVPFQIRVPAALGTPGEVYVAGSGQDARLSLVYPSAAGLPRTDETGIGALVQQFRATIERDLLAKQIFGGAQVETVVVAGVEGYWLSGGPHQVTYVDPDGIPTQDHSRLAGNTLLWEKDGVLYRLETELTQSRAIEVASSMF